MELKETVQMMDSEDYKERFKAEYLQAKIRYDKLDAMTVKYEAGTLNFTPSCSLELLKEQKKYMGCYIRCLKIRAEIEKIDLKEVEKKAYETAGKEVVIPLGNIVGLDKLAKGITDGIIPIKEPNIIIVIDGKEIAKIALDQLREKQRQASVKIINI